MSTLTVTVITKNEERCIDACLASIADLADEIIVLDSGSTDSTIAICESYNAKVSSVDWPGFGVQKQRAVAQASCDWVLSLDSDEVVTAELSAAIKQAITSNDFQAYYLYRLTFFAGKPIRFGDKHYILRLFRKDSAKFTPDKVHERLVCSGAVGKIRAPFYHYPYRNVANWMQKMNHYTDLSVQQKRSKGKKSGILKALFSAIWTFNKHYFFKGGFMDGRVGFVMSVNWSMGSFYRYAKLALDDDFIMPGS